VDNRRLSARTAPDKQIDELVCERYELTEDKNRIVEGVK
jgi:hypothetical protein